MKHRLFVFVVCVSLVLATALVGGTAKPVKAATLQVPSQYATIQEAVAAASPGDTINVAAGTYVLDSQVNLDKAGLTLTGAGSASTIIQVSGTGYRFLITAAGVTIDGFHIQKTDKTGVQNIIGISTGASDTSITNNEISGQYVFGDTEVSRAMEVTGGLTGLNITGNTIHDIRQPAYINGLTTGTVSNNYVYKTRGWVVAGGDMTFTNNTWGTSGNANYLDIAIDSGVAPTYYTDIPAMAAANNGAFIEDQRTTPWTLSIVYVDGSVGDSGNGTATSPVKTINEGVTRVVAGGTVNVAAGTYTESVSTSKSLTLKGAQWSVDARDRSGSESVWVVPSPASPAAFYATVTTGTITVDGFKFVGGPGCVDLRRATVVFNNNIVEVPEGCEGPINVYYLVKATSAGSVTIEHNDISTTEPTLLSGVACLEVKISLNPGIVMVDGNRFHNASGSGGFTFESGVNAGTMYLTNNEIYDNAGDGVVITGKFDALTGTYNSIHDNSGNGVTAGFTGTKPATVDLHYCDIYGNGPYGVQNADTSGLLAVDATYNWWGDSSGPSGVGPGTGDAVSAYVNYTPWLGQSICTPTVASVNPNAGQQGQTLNGVVITGTYFTGASAVSFGSGITVTGFTVNSATQIAADITIAAEASTGARDVSVTTPAGTGTLEDGFTVDSAVPSVPTITSVDPDNGNTETSYSVTINGTNLTGATAVSFGYGITTNSFTVNTSTRITASITIGITAPGTRDVSVTTPAGTGTLDDGFTVNSTCPPAAPGWYEQSTSYTVGTYVYLNQSRYQTFTPATCHFFQIAAFALYKEGTPEFTVTISLHMADAEHMPTGPSLHSTTFAASSLTTTYKWYEYALDPGYQVAAGVEYALVLSGDGGNATNRVVWGVSSSNVYDPGIRGYSVDGGITWVAVSTSDMAFKQGQAYPPSISAVFPNQALQGETLEVVISGVGLYGATYVGFGEGITVNSYTADSTDQIIAAITADASAVPGPRDVSVSTPVGDYTLAGAFTVVGTPPPAPSGWYEQFTTHNSLGSQVYGPNQRYQTFTPSVSHVFDYVSLCLYKAGTPSFTVTISLYRVNASRLPAGNPLCSTTFAASSLTTAPSWYEFGYTTGYQLLADSEYALVVSGDGGSSSNNIVVMVNTDGGYNRGERGYSVDSGITFVAQPTQDMVFKEGQKGAPAVTGSYPCQWLQGQTALVNIMGAMMSGATSVDFGAGIAVNSFTVVSGSMITANLTIDAAASPGSRDVVVTAPLGTGTLTGGFTVISTPPAAPAGWYEQQTGDNSGSSIYGPNLRYQTFTPSVAHKFDMVSFLLYKAGNPNYTVTLALHQANQDHLPFGPALSSTDFAASSLTKSATWYEFSFASAYQLMADAEYAIVLSGSGGDASNNVIVRVNTADGYARGERGYSVDGGVTWMAQSTQDLAFKEGQTGAPVVTGVSPSQWLQGQTAVISITGAMVGGATAVSFGSGITVNSFTPVSSVELTVVITIDAAASPGPRDVSVTNPSGTDTLAGGFTVVETPPAAPSGWYEQSTTSNAATWVYGSQWRYQTFTPSTSHYFNQVSFCLYKAGNPNYTVTISLYQADANHMPVGSALCSTTFAASSLTNTATWYEYSFASGYQLLAGAEYAIVLSGNGGDTSNTVYVRVNTTNTYSPGDRGYSVDAGTSWVLQANQDMAFREGQL